MSNLAITTEAIKDVFNDELYSRSGTEQDAYWDGDRLFIRGLLPQVEEVARDDELQNGIALRATETKVFVHPFILRKICDNGQVVSMTIASQEVDRQFTEASWVEVKLRDAIDYCSQPKLFASNVFSISRAMTRSLDRDINLLSFFRQHLKGVSDQLVERIISRLFQEDATEYGLMNAVTSVARDTPDHEERWKLEEFGAKIGMGHFDLSPPVQHSSESISKRQIRGKRATGTYAADESSARMCS